jgi:non-homologous end joining protein Ku
MNDRIAFVKHLFDDSTEDYNRVLSQLNSFTTKEEAVDFIEEIIKPDYNNWDGSEEYAERFMEIVKNKFN